MTDGWRRLPAIVLLCVFALIQGWAPLLHAHVGNGDAGPLESDVRGIHLPDRVLVSPHGHVPGRAQAVHAECHGSEGALVTAPTEHRRDDRLTAAAATDAVPPSHAPPDASSEASSTLRIPLSVPFIAKRDSAPPFPAGPPGAC